MTASPLRAGHALTPRALRRIGLRLVVAWTALGAALVVGGPTLVAPLLPAVDLGIEALQPSVRASVATAASQDGWTVAAEVFAVEAIEFPSGRSFPPGATVGRYSVTVPHAVLPLLLFLGTALAWPAHDRRETARRLLVAAPVAILLFVASTAVVLAGHVEIGFLRRAGTAGDPLHRHPLAAAMVFMESGGRWLAALVAALVVIRACATVNRRPGAEPAATSPMTAGATALAFPPVNGSASTSVHAPRARPSDPPDQPDVPTTEPAGSSSEATRAPD